MTLYRYIGPDAIRERATQEPTGAIVTRGEDLANWLHGHPEALDEGATFVIDVEGVLRLAPRRSEHVACAGGGLVQAAGELRFELRHGSAVVMEASNQSTGYAPEPESWSALAVALDALGVEHPGRYTIAFEFRRCPSCAQLNVVKDGWFYCDTCDAQLPVERNVR
jgi:hypothetical protein